jgi:hypothetical protein
VTVLEHAIRYRERGLFPVPLAAKSKVPLIKWGELRGRQLPPLAVLQRWFEDDNRNIGILCGKASGGLVVLDFDSVPPYYVWRRGYPVAAASYTVRSGRGFHVYVRPLPSGSEMPRYTLSMGLGESTCDICTNGYVAAPPSLHPSGRAYQALDVDAPILYVELEEAGLVIVPLPTFPFADNEDGALPPTQRIGSSGDGLVGQIKRAMPLMPYLQRYVQLQATSSDGRWQIGLCPFHDDRSPSLWVDTVRDICRCWSPACPAHERVLDVIGVYALVNRIPNEKAIYELAGRLGL